MLEDLNLDNTEDKDHPDELTEYEWAELCSTVPSPYDCQYCRHYKDIYGNGERICSLYHCPCQERDLQIWNPDEPVEVATMDEGKKEDLRKLFLEMNSVDYRTENKTEKELVEVTENGKKVKKEKNVTKTYLYITTSHLDLETMMDKKSFTADQKKMCRALLEDKNNVLWLDVLHGMGIFLVSIRAESLLR